MTKTIPKGWATARLKNICEVTFSSVDKHLHPEEKHVRLFNYMDVYKKDYAKDDSDLNFGTVTEEEFEKFRLIEGDVLITKDSETPGDIARSCFVQKTLEGVVCGYHVAILKPRENTLQGGFLKRIFDTETYHTYFSSLANGATRFGLNKGAILKAEFDLPPLPEQNRIVQILETWDEALELLDKKVAIKKDLKTWLLQEFVTGKRRLNGFNQKWKLLKTGDVAEISAGGTPLTNNSNYWGGNILWMNSGDLNKRIIYDVKGRITELGLKNSSAKIVPVNSVLIGLAGQGKTRGTVAINKVPLTTNQSVAFFIPDRSQTDHKFLFFNFYNRYSELRSISAGDGGRGGLNLKILKNLPLLLPPLPEQIAIAKILTAADDEIEALEQKRKLLAEQKKFLLNKLVTGEILTPENLTV